MTLVQRLREASAKATPGPWWSDDYDDETDAVDVVGVPDADGVAPTVASCHEGGSDNATNNAAFIALCDPATITRLLDVVEAAQSLYDAMPEGTQGLAGLADRLAALDESEKERT